MFPGRGDAVKSGVAQMVVAKMVMGGSAWLMVWDEERHAGGVAISCMVSV